MHIRFDGYEIGCTHDDEVFIAEYQIGETEIETNDTNRTGVDGVHPGTDYLRDAQWVFNLTTHKQDGTAGVLEQLGALERAWKGWRNRTEGRVRLEYRTSHTGAWSAIYGRPRQYVPPHPSAQTAKGRGTAQITFMQQDPLHYSSAFEETTIGVAAGASGGLVAPITVPITVGRTGGTRETVAVNRGNAPAPVVLQFHGPVTNPVLQLMGEHGWRFTVRGSLAWDETLTVDPFTFRAYVESSTQPARRPAPQMIANGSRFDDLRLPPGQSVFRFTAVDDTYQASVTAQWPHTSTTMH